MTSTPTTTLQWGVCSGESAEPPLILLLLLLLLLIGGNLHPLGNHDILKKTDDVQFFKNDLSLFPTHFEK